MVAISLGFDITISEKVGQGDSQIFYILNYLFFINIGALEYIFHADYLPFLS